MKVEAWMTASQACFAVPGSTPAIWDQKASRAKHHRYGADFEP